MVASLIAPTPQAIASVPPAQSLSPEETVQFECVKQHFAVTGFELPVDGKHGRATGLSEGERYWLSRDCILRYLKSSKNDGRQAISRIHATLIWRREIGVDEIHHDEIESEGVCGKAFLLGYSARAEPLFYITPSKRDTEPSEKQFRHIVWLWERCIDLMGPGVDGAVVLLNFAGKSKRPSVTLSTRILSMMTHHYPQRVGAAYIQNTPFVLNAFLSVVWPFIDPSTKEKIDTKGKVGSRVDKEVLIGEWNGDLGYDYNHSTYWPYLLDLAGSKRQAAYVRWLNRGAQLGACERELRRWDDGVAEGARSPSFDEDVKRVTMHSDLDVPILV